MAAERKTLTQLSVPICLELFCSSFPMINEKENIGETSEKHRRQIGEQTSTIHSKRLDIQKRKSFSGVGNNFVRALATEIDNKEEYEFLKGNKELEAIFSQYLKQIAIKIYRMTKLKL